jgi:threonine/homoserine/homoserine lactone efflux protein
LPLTELTALLVLATLTSFTPGPNTTLSTALAANLGLRHALRFVLAVPVGWGVLLCVCAAGVGSLVMTWPMLHLALQSMGVGYLLWLAFKLARTHRLSSADTAALNVGFTQGVLLQFLNIKAWMLALTVVAGWLAGHDDALQRFAVVLPLMLCFGFASNLTYALAGALLREWLSGPDPTHQRLRIYNRCMAAILVATALWMTQL